ncbi:VanZ family protein [Evansella sp. AB-P1]|uniref:VanZ family protein n=1 Tax=Evansella sp. AB-P1 TaxID=3037653 RepID=UPI00241D93CA|nr:VanZ family protein [Evansella sp. AB-P1]MDG5786786.1 VanZ family protein [Evansella sp. AB-P1]
MRFAFPVIIFLSLLVIIVSIGKETNGSMDTNIIRSIYKAEVNPLFFLDWNSSFYSSFSIIDGSATLQLRKIGHFIFYGTLAAFIFIVLPIHNIWIRGVTAASSSSIIGAIDEYHQYFLSDRSGRLFDIYINIAGSFFTIFTILVLYGLLLMKQRIKYKYEMKYDEKQTGREWISAP